MRHVVLFPGFGGRDTLGNVFDSQTGFARRGGSVKSLNVKKIATAAAGAAMLGAAFAGAVQVDSAGLENFPFYSNGAPNLKIVVGGSAAASDAVAAANIAAMIGNLAYTSKDITVLGTDLLSCSGGTAGTTSSSDSVSLEVTTPGVNPNVAYQMKTYIEGYLDANVTDDKTDSMTGSLTILADSSGTSSSGGRKVTNSETSLAFKGTVTDAEVSKSYTEDERYYLYAKTQYDTSSKSVKAKTPQIAYEAVFTDPVQVCTEFTPDDSVCTDTYKTSKHRMKIKLLGSDWVIFGMDNFPSDGTVNTTAQLQLGKEIQFKEFMQIGDEVSNAAGIKAKLKDISAVPTGTSQLLSSSFEIFDANGNLIDTSTLQENGEYNQNGIVIRVFEVFAGLGQTSYAKVSIFSDKLTLQHGSVVSTDNQNWRVNLVGGGTSFGSSLRKIQLTRQVVDDFSTGGSVTFLQKPQLMKLTFNGLEDVTYDSLSFNTGERNFPVSSTDTSTNGQSYVRLTSTLTSPFDFGSTSSNTLYYVTDATAAGNATQGTVFYQDSTTGLFVPFFGSSATSAAVTGNVSFSTAVTTLGVSTGAAIYVYNNTGVQCTTGGWTNGTQLSANSSWATTGWTPGSAFAVTGGTPLTTGYTAASFTGNLTLTASTLVSGCTGNATLSFESYNGTLTPGLGTTGVTYTLGNNYVKYTYGATSQNLRFNSQAIEASTTDPDGTDMVIWIPEFTKDDDTTPGAFALDVGYGDQSSPRLAPGSGTATAQYQGTYLVTSVTGTAYEAGYVSPRGSKLESIGLNDATIKYATSLSHALYTLSSAGVDTTANTATNDFKAGETALEDAGYKVVVKGIAAAGTGSGTGGSVSGVDGLQPSQSQAFSVTPIDTSSSPLVVRDSGAGTQPLIVVGGPLVNSVASSALQGAPAPSASDEAVVKVQGDRILVYGYTASDTTSAANSLISWLAANADTVTGR